MIWSFSLVFLVCDFGHKVNAAFGQIDYAFDHISWYLFPYAMWKLLPIIIIGAQQSTDLSVFGRISCSREDFKKVSWILITIKLETFHWNIIWLSFFFRWSIMVIRISWYFDKLDCTKIEIKISLKYNDEISEITHTHKHIERFNILTKFNLSLRTQQRILCSFDFCFALLCLT